jgi:Icc-related predicted phosphoesterase
MKITTISDVHGMQDRLFPLGSGDLLICAGDITPNGTQNDIEEFLRWYADQDFDKKVLIAGNHDWGFERSGDTYYIDRCKDYGIDYLNDSMATYKGLKIWGSPVQPEFFNWAFNRARTKTEADYKFIKEIKPHWDKIPNNVDILVTHGPPMGVLDLVELKKSPNFGENVGCELLMEKVTEIKPKMHIFGHIHNQRGVKVLNLDGVPVTFVNAACLNDRYRPYQEDHFTFDWDKVLLGNSIGRDY